MEYGLPKVVWVIMVLIDVVDGLGMTTQAIGMQHFVLHCGVIAIDERRCEVDHEEVMVFDVVGESM